MMKETKGMTRGFTGVWPCLVPGALCLAAPDDVMAVGIIS